MWPKMEKRALSAAPTQLERFNVFLVIYLIEFDLIVEVDACCLCSGRVHVCGFWLGKYELLEKLDTAAKGHFSISRGYPPRENNILQK